MHTPTLRKFIEWHHEPGRILYSLDKPQNRGQPMYNFISYLYPHAHRTTNLVAFGLWVSKLLGVDRTFTYDLIRAGIRHKRLRSPVPVRAMIWSVSCYGNNDGSLFDSIIFLWSENLELSTHSVELHTLLAHISQLTASLRKYRHHRLSYITLTRRNFKFQTYKSNKHHENIIKAIYILRLFML